jgi:hypothetical protein
MQCACALLYCHARTLPLLPYFPKLYYKRKDFRKKLLNTNVCLFLLKHVWNIYHSKNSSARYEQNCTLPFTQSTRYSYLLTYIITYWLTHSLTPYSTVLLENPIGLQPAKKFTAFCGTWMFITAFTSTRHLPLSWASSIQSIPPHHTSRRSVLNIILPSTPGSPQWSLSLRFPHQNPVHAFPLHHISYMHFLSHSSGFYHPHNIGWAVQIM